MTTNSNLFITSLGKKDTITENGAISNSTSGKATLDYFAKAGTYRDREITAVHADVSRIFGEDKLLALKIVFYLRMITRKVKGLFTSEAVQKGQGVRDEFRKAIVWFAKYQPEFLYKNLWLIPVAGSWKDLWHIDMLTDLDKTQVYELIKKGLSDPYNRGLIAKYLPKIRSKSNTKNMRHIALNKFAIGFCHHMDWTADQYRRFKSNPENSAHLFQRQMSARLWDQLDFNRIPGKALFSLVTHRGKDKKTTIERHGLEKVYEKWIKAQPVAKFTGYVYELGMAVKYGGYGTTLTAIEKHTIDKQFDGLIELARKDSGGLKGNVWVAIDTSGSMSSEVNKSGVRAVDISTSLGVYFATLNEGAFKDHVIMFNSKSTVKKLSGTFSDKIHQLPKDAMGGTNFQSIVDEIVRIRKSNPTIPVEDYPSTILVVSDMQFNPAGSSYWSGGRYVTETTNYEELVAKLVAVGLPKPTMVWWFVTGRGGDVPSTLEDEGTVLVSGFDGAVISLILGGETTVTDTTTGKTRMLNPEEQMLKALNQELLNQIQL